MRGKKPFFSRRSFAFSFISSQYRSGSSRILRSNSAFRFLIARDKALAPPLIADLATAFHDGAQPAVQRRGDRRADRIDGAPLRIDVKVGVAMRRGGLGVAEQLPDYRPAKRRGCAETREAMAQVVNSN